MSRRIRPDRPLTKSELQARYRKRHPEKVTGRKFLAMQRLASHKWLRKQPVVQYIRQYKAGHPCTDCREGDPVVLEFDHVRGVKRFTIGQKPVRRSLEEVIEEIAKCEVVCANCHRRRNARRVQDSLRADGISTRLLEQVFGTGIDRNDGRFLPPEERTTRSNPRAGHAQHAREQAYHHTLFQGE